MKTLPQRIYQFGVFRVDAAAHLLLRNQKPMALMPKAFDLLLFMVQNTGRLLRRDELMASIWPDTHVEGTNLNVNLSVIRKVLGESPKDHRYIVTVPGKGYKFVADVKTENSGASYSPREQAKFTNISAQPQREATTSLAVVPFTSIGCDSKHKYLGLGIREALTADLSRIPEVDVRPITAQRLGITGRPGHVQRREKVKVQYLFEGSIQQFDSRLRVTLQLIDARAGRLIWAGKFDGNTRNAFDFQDAISTEAAFQLSTILSSKTPSRKVGQRSSQTKRSSVTL